LTTVIGTREEVSFFESSALWEIPLGDNDSVVAAPWIEQNYDTPDGWRGEATLGVKHTLMRGGTGVMAVQAGALWMSEPPLGCGDGGAELRWLGGLSLERGAFVNLEAATRALAGGCGGERIELTVGYRPAENWLGMAQLFMDEPRLGEEILKAQLTVVRFGENGRGIQAGVRARIDGGGEEPALVIGFWGRPGG